MTTNPVNTWMLANGWEWHTIDEKANGFWIKGSFLRMPQDLATEMYRMSEVRVAEALQIKLGQVLNRLDEAPYIPYKGAPHVNWHEIEAILDDEIDQLAATNPRKEIEG